MRKLDDADTYIRACAERDIKIAALEERVEELEREINERDQKDFYKPDAELHKHLDSLRIPKSKYGHKGVSDGSYARITSAVEAMRAKLQRYHELAEKLGRLSGLKRDDIDEADIAGLLVLADEARKLLEGDN